MNFKNSISKQIFQITGSILCFAGLATQLYIVIKNTPASGHTYLNQIIMYFSYMTIWTNIVVMLCFLIPLIAAKSKLSLFLTKPIVETGVLLYILVVGIVYHTMLRQLWDPKGLQLIADNLLHTVVPAFYLLYWIFFAEKSVQPWANSFRWLIYPLIYGIYILIRGAFVDQYPYPFIDVTVLGYEKTLLNILLFTAGYFVFGLLLIFIDKLFAGKRTTL